MGKPRPGPRPKRKRSGRERVKKRLIDAQRSLGQPTMRQQGYLSTFQGACLTRAGRQATCGEQLAVAFRPQEPVRGHGEQAPSVVAGKGLGDPGPNVVQDMQDAGHPKYMGPKIPQALGRLRDKTCASARRRCRCPRRRWSGAGQEVVVALEGICPDRRNAARDVVDAADAAFRRAHRGAVVREHDRDIDRRDRRETRLCAPICRDGHRVAQQAPNL